MSKLATYLFVCHKHVCYQHPIEISIISFLSCMNTADFSPLHLFHLTHPHFLTSTDPHRSTPIHPFTPHAPTHPPTSTSTSTSSSPPPNHAQVLSLEHEEKKLGMRVTMLRGMADTVESTTRVAAERQMAAADEVRVIVAPTIRLCVRAVCGGCSQK